MKALPTIVADQKNREKPTATGKLWSSGKFAPTNSNTSHGPSHSELGMKAVRISIQFCIEFI